MENKTGKRRRIFPIAAAVLALLAAGIGTVLALRAGGAEGEREVITVSTLEKIIDISELSTFTAVYNGIAEVKNEDDPEKTDYYVSYEARVNAGIDFDKIVFAVDREEKTIHITLPQVRITKSAVDITTLDYIFLNEKKNGSAITEEAYKACEADVRSESEKEDAILTLARQNAENIIKALIEPFVGQLDAEYLLDIAWEG